MCIAIFPLLNDQIVQVEFALERIYQRRNGGVDITVDLLVHNASSRSSIDRIRILLPHALVDLPRLSNTRATVESAVPEWIQLQMNGILQQTYQLAAPDDESNWPYRVLGHVRVDRGQCSSGVLVIRREGQESGSDTLRGFIKQDWKLESPPSESFNIWTWLLFGLNQTAVVDLVCRGSLAEQLHVGENMWIRVTFQIPPVGVNQKPWTEKLIARSYEYLQVFKSPARLCQDTRKRLEGFDGRSHPQLSGDLATAIPRALQYVPDELRAVCVKDWRTFLYREYGLGVRNLEQRAALPRRLGYGSTFTLPPAADPKGCRRFPLPLWAHFLKKGNPRDAEAAEFFFGTDFRGCRHPDNYMTESYTIAGNAIYVYLIWLAIILGITNLVLKFSL
jgi:hypothetical protein